MQQVRTTRQQTNGVENTTNVTWIHHDQSSFCLSDVWLRIRDMTWTTLLIGTVFSAFTTGDLWVIPSILALLVFELNTVALTGKRRRWFSQLLGRITLT